MTLQQIYYVLKIYQEGSINRAAESLFMTQSSLTNALQKLEQELGISLYIRSSKGMIPTTEGLDFLKYARQLYQHYESFCMRYEQKTYKRKFSVSMQHYSFAVKAFIATVKQYGTALFDFSILETKTKNVIRDVAQADSEIGILFISTLNQRRIMRLLQGNNLVFHKLIESSAYVYLHKTHPLAERKALTFHELQDYPCLFFSQGSDNSSFFAEEILSEYEYPQMIHVSDRGTMVNLLTALQGYTLCSGIISEELNGNEFLTVPFEEDAINKNVTMTIGYIVRKHDGLSEIGECYIRELKRCLFPADQDQHSDQK